MFYASLPFSSLCLAINTFFLLIVAVSLLQLPAGAFTDHTSSGDNNEFAKNGTANVTILDFQVNSTDNKTFSNISSLTVNYTGDDFKDISKVSVYNGSGFLGSNASINSRNITVFLNTSNVTGATNGNISNVTNSGNRTLLDVNFDINDSSQDGSNVSAFVGNITGNNISYVNPDFQTNQNTSTAGNMTIDAAPPEVFGANTTYLPTQNGVNYNNWVKNDQGVRVNVTIYDNVTGVNTTKGFNNVTVSKINTTTGEVQNLTQELGIKFNTTIIVNKPGINGTYWLPVNASDNSSQWDSTNHVNSTSGIIRVNVDNEVPRLAAKNTTYAETKPWITAAQAGNNIGLTVNVSETYSGIHNVTVNASPINSNLDWVNMTHDNGAGSGNWTNVSVPVGTGTDNGSYLLNVSATDNVTHTNETTSGLLSVQVDNEKPAVSPNTTEYPGFQTAAQVDDTVTLNVNISESVSGVHNVTVNASPINSSLEWVKMSHVGGTGNWTNDSVTIGSGANNGTHGLNVTVYDNASNMRRTTGGPIQVQVDNEKSKIKANSTNYPAGQTHVKDGDTVTLNVNVSESVSGVYNVTVNASLINTSLNWVPLNHVAGTGNWTNSSVSIEGADNGTHLLNVTVYDNASNTNTSQVDPARLQVQVDNEKPRLRGNSTGYTGNNPNWAKLGETITLNANVSESISGVKNVSVNATPINSSLGNVSLNHVAGTGNWTNGSVTAGGVNGTFHLNITSYDNATNYNVSNSQQSRITVNVDNEKPTISDNGTTYPAGQSYATNGDVVTVNVNISDTLSGVNPSTVLLNGSKINATYGWVELNQAGSGNYTNSSLLVNSTNTQNLSTIRSVEINATDNNGNKNSSGNVTVKIDSESPTYGVNTSSWAYGQKVASQQGSVRMTSRYGGWWRGWTTKPDIWVTNSPENNETVIVANITDAHSGLNASTIKINFSPINDSLGTVPMVDNGSIAEDTPNDGNYTANVSVPVGVDLGFSGTYDYKNPDAFQPIRLAQLNITSGDNASNTNTTKAPALVYVMAHPPMESLTASGNTDRWQWNESATVNMQNQSDMSAVDMHFRVQLNQTNGGWIDVAGLNFSNSTDMVNQTEMNAFMNATKSFNVAYDNSTGYMSVTMDGSKFDELNNTANVTMHNVNKIGISSSAEADNASVLQDNALNTSLNLTYSSKINGTINFTVGHFSTYAVDAQDPVTILTSPSGGSTVKGTKDVKGTVKDGSWGNWNVSVRKNGSTGSWTEVVTGTSTKESTTLGSWNTKSFSDGEYDVKLMAEDAANRTNSTMVTLNVSNPTTTTGGTTSSPAAAPPSLGDGTVVKQYQRITSIVTQPGEPAEVQMPEGSPVKNLRVTTNRQSIDPSFAAGEHSEKPSDVTDPSPTRSVQKYISITTSIPDKDIDSAEIDFSVEQSWLNDNGFAQDEVILMRHSNDQWQDLETELLGEADGELQYSAQSPGFSVFAVSGEKKTAAATPTDTAMPEATTTPAPEATDTPAMTEEPETTPAPEATETPTPGMTLLAGISGLAAALFARRRRE